MLKTYFRTELKFDHVCPFEEPVKYQSKYFISFNIWQNINKENVNKKTTQIKTQLDFWIVNSGKTCGTSVWFDTRKGNKMTRVKPLEVSISKVTCSEIPKDFIRYLKLHLATRLKIQNSESGKNQITAAFQENPPTKGYLHVMPSSRQFILFPIKLKRQELLFLPSFPSWFRKRRKQLWSFTCRQKCYVCKYFGT